MFERRRRHSQPVGSPLPAETGGNASEFFSRNWAFISSETQALLGQKVLFAAGVGLSSNIVLLACRTGFRRFLVADGDTVEVSNLNRQAYGQPDVGHNKAEALAEAVRRIRPEAQVETIPRFLDERTYLEPVARADIVINSIDFANPTFLLLNRVAQAANKPVLLPVNLGWGGAVLVFTLGTQSLDDFLGLRAPGASDIAVRLITRIFERVPGGVPPYLGAVLQDFTTNYAAWPCDPQLGVAATVTSALAVRAAVALAAGEPVRTVPDVLYCDVRQLTEAPVSAASSHTPPAEPPAATEDHTASAEDQSVPMEALSATPPGEEDATTETS